jgi:hypothetical protein
MDRRLNTAYWVLRIGLGLGPFLAGLDKFFNILADWSMVDGKFVKFDSKGSDLAKEALQKSDKKDHLRATVSGEMKDGVIQVSSLTLD